MSYANEEETLVAGDLYYMPPGHTFLLEEDIELVEFNPPRLMDEVGAVLRRNLVAADSMVDRSDVTTWSIWRPHERRPLIGEHHEGRVPGTAGIDLYYHAWRPEGGTIGAVEVSLHGFGLHSGLYGSVGAYLVPYDDAVYGLNYRGHGRSSG